MLRTDVRHQPMQAKIVNEFHLQSERRLSFSVPRENISFFVFNTFAQYSIVLTRLNQRIVSRYSRVMSWRL